MITESLYTPNCIRTFSRLYMNVFEPTEEMIRIEDIAHALSMQCRFGGHLPKFYSVAQHSVHCCEEVSEVHQLAALLHDASEAYLVDIPSPVKSGLANYKQLEDRLMKVIAKKFGFDYPLHPDVKIVDESMLHAEWEYLMLEKQHFLKFRSWSQDEAKGRFLNMFYQISPQF